jgi:hypothetical protein
MNKPFRLITICFITASAAHAALNLDIDFSNFVTGTEADQTNTATGEWYDGSTGLVFTDVSTGVGVIIEATSSYAYNTNTSGSDGENAMINMQRSTSTDFTLTFYDQSTGQAVDTSFFGGDFSFSLSFFDLDGTEETGIEQVSMFNADSYTVLSSNSLDISEDDSGTVTAKAPGTTINVTNPSTGNNLNSNQEAVMIVFNYTNISSIDFNYTISGGNINNVRNLLINGDEFTVFSTGETDTIVVPEARTTTALIGSFALTLAFLRRRKRSIG